MGRKDIETQRKYYADTAEMYDATHMSIDKEHIFALSFLNGMIEHLEVNSVLDVGSGTGRVIQHLYNTRPNLHVIGIEPVPELRAVGYKKGISEDRLIDGNATNLAFEDESFDLVCEFAVLHHIPNPEVAVCEMLRVAKKAIFISDANRFGQGTWVARKIKQALSATGLWNTVNLIKSKGKGYTVSEGDGLAYSYSVFDNYRQISKKCSSVHIINTLDAGSNLYSSAPSIALLGIKN